MRGRGKAGRETERRDWIWAACAYPQHELAPLALRLGVAVLEARRARADRLGMRLAADPHGHVNVEAPAALLLVAIPGAHDVAERRLAAQEALVELLPPEMVRRSGQMRAWNRRLQEMLG